MHRFGICAQGLLVVLFAAGASAIHGWTQKERARAILSKELPELNGKHLKGTLVEVTYGPGESSLPHSHSCPVIVYMLEGTLRTQVKGQREITLKAGESFYEAPDGVHLVSANASQTAPARFVAYFICDHDAPLSTDPIHEPTQVGR